MGEDLGFVERKALEVLERVLQARNLSSEAVAQWIFAGQRALNDIKALVYGGTLNDGTQLMGYVEFQGQVLELLDRVHGQLDNTPTVYLNADPDATSSCGTFHGDPPGTIRLAAEDEPVGDVDDDQDAEDSV